MSWFKRTNKNINTKTEEKKDIPKWQNMHAEQSFPFRTVWE